MRYFQVDTDTFVIDSYDISVLPYIKIYLKNKKIKHRATKTGKITITGCSENEVNECVLKFTQQKVSQKVAYEEPQKVAYEEPQKVDYEEHQKLSQRYEEPQKVDYEKMMKMRIKMKKQNDEIQLLKQRLEIIESRYSENKPEEPPLELEKSVFNDYANNLYTIYSKSPASFQRDIISFNNTKKKTSD
jgi:hypothetical protein